MLQPKTHREVKSPQVNARYLADFMAASEVAKRSIIRGCKYQSIARVVQHDEVAFEALTSKDWPEIAQRIGRGPSETIDALNKAMTISNHHEWVRDAADRLIIGGDILWQAICASWARNCATSAQIDQVVLPIKDALEAKD